MKKETTTKKRPRNAFSSALIFQIRILFSTLIPSFLFTFHPSSRMCLQILFTVNLYYSTFVCCFFLVLSHFLFSILSISFHLSVWSFCVTCNEYQGNETMPRRLCAAWLQQVHTMCVNRKLIRNFVYLDKSFDVSYNIGAPEIQHVSIYTSIFFSLSNRQKI